jgi:hypothetical protein
MKYKEALVFVEEKQPLKGTVDDKGFLIGDIVIVPSEKNKCDLFLQNYIQNSGNVLCTFNDNDDVQVWAIDTAYLEKANILFYNKLAD